MKANSISSKLLLTETLRLLLQFLWLVALLVIAHFVVSFANGSTDLLAVVVGTFFALAFFSAPIASSNARAKRGTRLWTRSGGKAAIFCLVWGGVVVAGFIATLQLLQGMAASMPDYVVAMSAAGLVCAVLSMIPGER